MPIFSMQIKAPEAKSPRPACRRGRFSCRWNKTFIIFILIFFFVGFFNPVSIFSVSCGDNCSDRPEEEKLSCLSQVARACEAKLEETSTKKKTLQSAISYLDSQIAYTQSQINKTAYEIENLEKEIAELAGKIDILNLSLESTTKILLSRIEATYKQTKTQPLLLFLSSHGFSDFVNRYTYLKTAQENDRKVMFDLERARTNYDTQKIKREEKQSEVIALQKEQISQKSQLTSQQAAKNKLLEETKNDEKRYQELLAKAKAELQAIEAIIAGKGDETEVRDVIEGEAIASIMTDGSNLYACSTGAHLHFEVVKDKTHQNPAEKLSSKSVEWNNEPDGAFGFSGSWQWPLNDTVRITQGYGVTSYSSRYTGGIHTGIDMVNDSNREVKSVKKGKLYRGSISCRGGLLQYVRVDHSDDEYNTYYLHVNY